MTSPHAWLVLRAQSGDRQALETLLADIQQPLHRYVVQLIGDPSSADDVVQEALVRIYRKLRWLDDPAVFKPWAYRIASREAFRFLARRTAMQTRDADVELDHLPATEAAPPDPRELQRLIQGATPASRAVLLLHYQEDLTIDEVAAALDLPAGTVKSRLAYGLQRLRETLKKEPA